MSRTRTTALALCASAAAAALSPAAAQDFRYDALGRLNRAADETGVVTTYSYDRADNRTLRTVSSGGSSSPTEPGGSPGGATNQLPVAATDYETVPQDTPKVLTPRANDFDPDGDSLTIEALTQPAHGSAIRTDNNLSILYTPATGYSGQDSLIYTVSDARGGFASATVQITVQPASNSGPANQAPQMTPDAITTPRDTASPVYPRGNDWDPDNDPLVIVDKSNPAHGTAEIIDGGLSLRYTPNLGYSGPDSFTYTVSDGRGLFGTATISVTVEGGDPGGDNQPPQMTPDSVDTTQDTATPIYPRGNDWDPDEDVLTIVGYSPPAHGTAEIIDGGFSLRYTPAPGYVGTDVFSYTVSDGHGGEGTATITVKVAGTGGGSNNQPPQLSPDNVDVDPDVESAIYPRGNDWDPDGDPLVIIDLSDPAHGAASTFDNGLSIHYTPDPGYVGQDSFTYTVSDGRDGTGTATITVKVGDPIEGANQSPEAQNDAFQVPANTTSALYPRGNDWDPDSDPLTISAVSPPQHGTAATFDQARSIHYTPAAGYAGPDAFTYTVSDGRGGFATATISVTVAP